MKQAWGYVRLSQDGREGTIEQQKSDIRDYAKKVSSLSLVTTLNEGKRTSGFDADREKYNTLKGKIESGNVDAVIVRDRARIARDFDERMRFALLCRKQDVEVHVVEENRRMRLDNPMQMGVEAIQSAVDHKSKVAEIERSKSAVKERVDKGHWQGRPPFGFELDSEKEQLVPGEDFELALEVLSERDNGASYREIAETCGVASSTVGSILDRRELYESHEGKYSG
jgi:DNA invertase Pin-like site-specific DNA recombinase